MKNNARTETRRVLLSRSKPLGRKPALEHLRAPVSVGQAVRDAVRRPRKPTETPRRLGAAFRRSYLVETGLRQPSFWYGRDPQEHPRGVLVQLFDPIECSTSERAEAVGLRRGACADRGTDQRIR